MSKDQAIGTSIFLVCVIVAVGYVVFMLIPQSVIGLLGVSMTSEALRFWLVAVPVLIAFVAVLVIGAWIGWSMATTPPLKPIEELDKEIETPRTEQ